MLRYSPYNRAAAARATGAGPSSSSSGSSGAGGSSGGGSPSQQLSGLDSLVSDSLVTLQANLRQDVARVAQYKNWIEAALSHQASLLDDRVRHVNSILNRLRMIERGDPRHASAVFQFPNGTSDEQALTEDGLTLAEILNVAELNVVLPLTLVKSDSNCPICLVELVALEVAELPCGHQIHLQCGRDLARYSRRCTECRFDFVSGVSEEYAGSPAVESPAYSSLSDWTTAVLEDANMMASEDEDDDDDDGGDGSSAAPILLSDTEDEDAE